MQAFKVITNANMRAKVYKFVLKSVKKLAVEHLENRKIEDGGKVS